MSLDPTGGLRADSLDGSGRSSPEPRALRRTADDGSSKGDKSLRKYAATVERALASWEVSPQEWADYIAFLGRLLRAIQVHPQDVIQLPHSAAVASKLAQCLNPALPSGVHQKALEVYTYIFSIFREPFLATNLHQFLPGLCNVLAFASLSVRPALYALFEEFIIKLPLDELRPTLKSVTLSLLPALEDETGEDFERAFGILEALEKSFSGGSNHSNPSLESRGYFWQCLFLAIITSPTRRQGGLNYLIRKLPRFGVKRTSSKEAEHTTPNGHPPELEASVEAVISPEPGLLIRCFVCGLSDSQVLIQRGFLDLLVSNLPLGSPVLQQKAQQQDLDRLVSAAVHVLLRRDMSLNRRLWTWFLDPGTANANDESQPTSPTEPRKNPVDARSSSQFNYFTSYGKLPLERSVLSMFRVSTGKASERAKPFRICLSLMDRGEIGGTLVPSVFLPALRSVYAYRRTATSEELTEVLRSASLFFDGIESSLIWANLFKLLPGPGKNDGAADLELLAWIVQHFNLQDEEMLTLHLPNASLYLLSTLCEPDQAAENPTAFLTLDLLSSLLHVMPQRAFSETEAITSDPQNLISPHTDKSTAEGVRESLRKFYAHRVETMADTPFSREATCHIFQSSLAALIIRYLGTQADELLARAIGLLLAFTAKFPALHTSDWNKVQGAVEDVFADAQTMSRSLPFNALNSILALISTLATARNETALQAIVDTEPDLTAQIWLYLSPTNPKYHVEAVKLLWQLEELTAANEGVEASLTALITNAPQSSLRGKQSLSEAAGCFAMLWSHTIPTASSNVRAGISGVTRRGSSQQANADAKQLKHREDILTEPLMLVIDNLSSTDTEVREVVRDWLVGLPSLERVLRIHFDRLLVIPLKASQPTRSNGLASTRHELDAQRELEYLLTHLRNIVQTGIDVTSLCLEDMSVDMPRADSKSGLTILSEVCVRILCIDTYSSPYLDRLAIDIIDALLNGPCASALRPLGLEIDLLDRLMVWLKRDSASLQGPMLQLLSRALKIRMGSVPTPRSDSRRRSSTGSKRPSSAGVRPEPSLSTSSLVTTPPPQLLACLNSGFSARASRQHLNQWLEFLTETLPIFSDSIFSNVIPLVECLCKELHRSHEQLLDITKIDSKHIQSAPESEAMILLEALEIVLARAHESLEVESASDNVFKSSASSQNLLGNVAAGVFKTENFNKPSQANSRLTVILAFQDAIKACMELWTWGSHSADIEGFDKNSAATTAFNALRLRNRTRHLLEQIFAVESLESLEVVMSRWCYATEPSAASSAIDLLHVMQGSRPRNVVPAILDSLCSRTNPSSLPQNRLSSQTIDLSALDVALFLSAYISSIEDDAMDEVWSELIVFWKEVLANPLPHRQVLPALLSAILLVAQKVENTNFGDQRKMKKDLGDIFQRLLAATFTAIPSGYVTEPVDSTEQTPSKNESKSAQGVRDMGLAPVLVRVVADIDVVLETTERATAAINNISVNLIGPLFHAKSFPRNITADTLALLLQMAKKAPTAKTWRKDLSDAFNDPKLLMSPLALIQSHWFPVLHQWSLHDKERMAELIVRLAPPSTAGIMFGVGANAARLDADRKTQLNLRRICLLLLASPEDTYIAHTRTLEEKLVELFDASPSSSPSSAVKAELFMLYRAIVLSTSGVQLAPLWPVINDSLQAALTSLLPHATAENASGAMAFNNFTLLQASKLLDLLVALSPDEFQLHEWLYISDTIDAVYKPANWNPSALSDQIADALANDSNTPNLNNNNGIEDTTLSPMTPTTSAALPSGRRRRRPLIANDLATDKEDWKAMARDDFAKAVLQPFFSQLSLHAYEGVYSLEVPDAEVCRKGLLEDVLDLSTIVE